ncbi:MAG: helix-turn-helix transcriptional regulator, partial [Xanthomonadaceae bacterium]|nr:helix-turn-helix transcriptional regulator [Xanthomonadaceae bacterium]
RFSQAIGLSPLDYLTRLRMQLARDAIAGHGATVTEAAALAGYATESAFSRAFKRVHGQSPGTLRSA